MPVGFLSEDQVAAHGRFVGPPTSADLARFFVLDGVDLELIGRRRGAANRLGFAVQLCTVRFLGMFAAAPDEVPGEVTAFVAEQLGVDPGLAGQYAERIKTRLEHQWQIREALRLVDYTDAEGRARDFLAARAWTRRERPSELFDHAVVWLRTEKVLLPGVTVLERLVAEVRRHADQAMFTSISSRVDPSMEELFDALLVTAPGQLSQLEYYRRSPTTLSGRQLALAVRRIIEIEDIGAHLVDVSDVPGSRLDALARHGLAADVASLRRLGSPRRSATMVAVVSALRITAIDDALDVFSMLMVEKLIRPAERVSDRNRLRGWDELATASATLASTGQRLLDLIAENDDDSDPIDDATAWQRLMASIRPNDIEVAVRVAADVAPASARNRNASVRHELLPKYRTVAQFLKSFADTIPLDGTEAARPVLDAFRRLGESVDEPAERYNVVESVITSAWRPFVFDADAGGYDHRAYVLCVLEGLHAALKRRDVFVRGSRKWGDPRARLLDGVAWTRARPTLLTALRLSDDPDPHINDLASRIDAGFLQLAQRVDSGSPAWIDNDDDGRARLHLEQLEAIPKPDSLITLDRLVMAMLPRIDLPELLMDIHARTGFLDEFHHYGETGADSGSRLDDLAVSLAAVFIVQGCNLGYTPVAKPGHPALTRTRLSHVNQNYVRAETIAAANSRLIDTQAMIPTAQVWGGGHVASVDGLRFVVPVRTLDAAPNARYFGQRRGVTWLNAINNQVAGIGAIVVTGTSRDSLHVLDVILNRDGGPQPHIIATDNASYSDIVFGLFRMLGYQFSPRLRDLPEQRLWRFPHRQLDLTDSPISELPIHNLSHRRITDQWTDMLRVVASLHTGTVDSHDLLRMLARGGSPSPLGAAFADYGRAAKTLHILSMTEPDDTNRRVVSQQLSSHEGRHAVARKVFHGQRGELRQRYRTGQEDQLGVLGLILNAIVLWNTIYIDAALDHLRRSGHPVSDADVARLSPLQENHLNVHGRYTIIAADPTAPLRPLRDPDVGDE